MYNNETVERRQAQLNLGAAAFTEKWERAVGSLSEDERQALSNNPKQLLESIASVYGFSEQLSASDRELIVLSFEKREPKAEATAIQQQIIEAILAGSGERGKVPAIVMRAVALLIAISFALQPAFKDAHAATPVPTGQSTAAPKATSSPADLLPTPTKTPEAAKTKPTATPTVEATPAITSTTEITSTETLTSTTEESEDQIVVEEAETTYRQVVVEVANARSQPSTSAEIVTKVLGGTEIEILETEVDSSGREWVKGRFLIIADGKSTEYEAFIATELLGPPRTENATTYTGESIGGAVTKEELLAKDPFRADAQIVDNQLVVVDHLGKPIERYDADGAKLVQSYETLTRGELQEKIKAGEIGPEFQDALTFFPKKLFTLDKQGEPQWVDGAQIKPTFRFMDGTLQAVIELGSDFQTKLIEWFPTPQQEARRGWGVLQFNVDNFHYFLDAEHPLPNGKYIQNIKNPRYLAAVYLGNLADLDSNPNASYYRMKTADEVTLKDWFIEHGNLDPELAPIEISEYSPDDRFREVIKTFYELIAPAIEENPKLEKPVAIKVRLMAYPQYDDDNNNVDRGFAFYATDGISYVPSKPYSIKDGVLTIDITSYNPNEMLITWELLRALSYVTEKEYGVVSPERIEFFQELPNHPELNILAFSLVIDQGEEVVMPLLLHTAIPQ